MAEELSVFVAGLLGRAAGPPPAAPAGSVRFAFNIAGGRATVRPPRLTRRTPRVITMRPPDIRVRLGLGTLRPVSKAQARLFGVVAGGKVTRLNTGLSVLQARAALRGIRFSELPARK